MATLTISSQTTSTVTDGTRLLPAVAILGKDGSNFQPSMDAAGRAGYVTLTDGTNSVSLVGSANVPVAAQAAATGGATPYKYLATAAADQDSTVVKASAGTLYALTFSAVAASLRYLKIYDKATAPTSADTPKHTLPVPASAGASVSLPLPSCGEAYANGIAFRMTTGVADNDAAAVTASDCLVNLSYK